MRRRTGVVAAIAVAAIAAAAAVAVATGGGETAPTYPDPVIISKPTYVKVCDKIEYVVVGTTAEGLDLDRFTYDLAVCDPKKSAEARKAQQKRDQESDQREKNLEAFRSGVVKGLSEFPNDDLRVMRIVQLACEQSEGAPGENREELDMLADLYEKYYPDDNKLPKEYKPSLLYANKEGYISTLGEICPWRAPE